MYTTVPLDAPGLGTQEVTGLTRAGTRHHPPHSGWNGQNQRDLTWCRTMRFSPGEDPGQLGAGLEAKTTFLSDSAKGTAALHFPRLTLLEAHPEHL